MFKIEKQEENGVWHDVRDAEGKPLVFADKDAARAKLQELFPVLVEMAKYVGEPRTRVIAVIEDEEDDWPVKDKGGEK